jgi:hypothetical protein
MVTYLKEMTQNISNPASDNETITNDEMNSEDDTKDNNPAS